MQNSNARRVSPSGTSGRKSMESCGDALKRIAPELIVSKQRLRQTDGISLVRSNRDEKKTGSGFQFPALCHVRTARATAA